MLCTQKYIGLFVKNKTKKNTLKVKFKFISIKKQE